MDGELRCVSCTPEQVAAYLGRSVRTIRNWVDAGKLDGGRIGRTIRVNGDDVRRAFPTGTSRRDPRADYDRPSPNA